MRWTDDRTRYGLVSRTLHWAMAALLIWQLAGMVLKLVLGRVPLMAFWVGTHASVGTLLLVLLVIRLGWAIAQRRRRPPHSADRIGRLALAGHLALYALMLVVPAIAVLRMIGNGRPIRLFGVELRGDTGERVEWMTAPASLLHGWLGWLLLALILGHVAMVLVHRYWWRDDVLHRMAGRLPD